MIEENNCTVNAMLELMTDLIGIVEIENKYLVQYDMVGFNNIHEQKEKIAAEIVECDACLTSLVEKNELPQEELLILKPKHQEMKEITQKNLNLLEQAMKYLYDKFLASL